MHTSKTPPDLHEQPPPRRGPAPAVVFDNMRRDIWMSRVIMLPYILAFGLMLLNAKGPLNGEGIVTAWLVVGFLLGMPIIGEISYAYFVRMRRRTYFQGQDVIARVYRRYHAPRGAYVGLSFDFEWDGRVRRASRRVEMPVYLRCTAGDEILLRVRPVKLLGCRLFYDIIVLTRIAGNDEETDYQFVSGSH